MLRYSLSSFSMLQLTNQIGFLLIRYKIRIDEKQPLIVCLFSVAIFTSQSLCRSPVTNISVLVAFNRTFWVECSLNIYTCCRIALFLYIYKHDTFYRKRSPHVLRSLHFVRPLSFQLFANSMLFIVYFDFLFLLFSLFLSFCFSYSLSLCLSHTLSLLLLLSSFIICFISFGY